MKRIKSILVILILSSILFSCSHTNLLKDYNLNGELIYFEAKVSPSGYEVKINDDYNPSFNDSSKTGSLLNTIVEIATSIGEGILAQDLYKKLNKAVNPDTIVNDIANDFQNNLIKLIKIRSTKNIYDEYQYFAQIFLEKCDVIISSNDIFLNLSVKANITNVPSAKVIWEYSTEFKKPFRSHLLSNTDSPSLLKNISQAYSIYSLSEDEIRIAINKASYEISKEIYETFREDYQKSLKNSNSR